MVVGVELFVGYGEFGSNSFIRELYSRAVLDVRNARWPQDTRCLWLLEEPSGSVLHINPFRSKCRSIEKDEYRVLQLNGRDLVCCSDGYQRRAVPLSTKPAAVVVEIARSNETPASRKQTL